MRRPEVSKMEGTDAGVSPTTDSSSHNEHASPDLIRE